MDWIIDPRRRPAEVIRNTPRVETADPADGRDDFFPIRRAQHNRLAERERGADAEQVGNPGEFLLKLAPRHPYRQQPYKEQDTRAVFDGSRVTHKEPQKQNVSRASC